MLGTEHCIPVSNDLRIFRKIVNDLSLEEPATSDPLLFLTFEFPYRPASIVSMGNGACGFRVVDGQIGSYYL